MDAPLSLCTRKYLEACNKLFERGLLCHSKIKDESSQVLMNIEEGYAFFSKWIASLMKEGEFSCCVMLLLPQDFFIADGAFNPCDAKQKKFLSWQSM